MRILLFIDSNVKTIPYEVPLLEMQRMGHEIIFLSILEFGSIHEEYKSYGIPVFSIGEKRITLKRCFYYINYLTYFCKKNRVDAVFAHLVIPSFISVLSQPFIKAKFVCFRHHFNFINLLETQSYKINKIDKFLDQVIARLAKKIVLPSYYLKKLIHQHEGVAERKMEVIPYVYNWEPFLKRSVDMKIRMDGNATLKLLMISRLTKLKRPELVLELLSTLQHDHYDVKLTIVGTGDLEAELKEFVKASNLSDKVRFEGFQKDVIPFLNECDILVHPSLTEASSSVVKEAGILGRPVIVCNGVGDFNDYIINNKNGWLVNPNNFKNEALYNLVNTEPEKRREIGQALRKTILDKFSLSTSVTNAYLSLLS